MRPKILFLISTLGGGIGTSLRMIIPFLYTRYDIRICEFLPGDESINKFITGMGIEIEKVGKPGIDLRIARDIVKTARRFQPDLIQGFELETNFYACVAARLAGRSKTVATFHGMVSAFRWVYSPFLQTIFVAANAVVCVSEALRKRCIRHALIRRPRCSVIRNGVDISRFSPAGRCEQPDRPFIVGYVANFYSTVKGHRYLLEAIASLPPRDRVQAWLVGDGTLLADMMRLAKELNIDHRVSFLGPRDDIPALLSQMDVFVLPSLTEGCPHALLEAMAAGVPVIATKVGGVPEIVSHNRTGILVPAESAEAIRDAVVQLMNDRSLRDLLRRNGRALIEREFTDRTAAEAYGSLYDKLLANKHP